VEEYLENPGKFVTCFAEGLGVSNSLIVELSRAMRAIEIARDKNWRIIWLETYLMFVLHAFSHPESVPWEVRNKWRNCIYITPNL